MSIQSDPYAPLIHQYEQRVEQAAQRVSDLEGKLEEAKQEHELRTFALDELRRNTQAIAATAPDGQPVETSFAGMTKYDAIVAVLRRHKKPRGTAQIVDDLLAGGLETKSGRQNLYRSVYAVLKDKASKPDKYPIRKAGKGWKLDESK